MNVIFALSDPKALEAMDIPVGILMVAGGVFLASIQKQQRRARTESVKRGDLTPERAAKIDRFMSWGGYAIAACGLIVIGLHYLPSD